MEYITLTRHYAISRIIIGCWQLAGGHGSIDREQVFADIPSFLMSSIDTFDCADIYSGVESMLGSFLQQWSPRRRVLYDFLKLPVPNIHTKFVPDLDVLPYITKAYVERIINRSLRRLRSGCIDLVQFHWWDYDIPRYVETAHWLAELQQEGKILHLGVTNFDVPHLREIVESGVKLLTHQVQYSLLDRRPEHGMVDFCRAHDIRLLCYGTLAGGFFSEKYLGMSEPQEPLENRSLTKYRLIIDEFGGWELFQKLLKVLSIIARKHGVSIANVAVRYILDKPQVAAVIIGARNTAHLQDTLRVFEFTLDDEDRKTIQTVIGQSQGLRGDVYELERVKGGKHASIMKYNLNQFE